MVATPAPERCPLPENIKDIENDPPAPESHMTTFRPVAPVARTRRDAGRPTGRTPKSRKLWTASVYFDEQSTAAFHAERLDPVPDVVELYGRPQVMVLQCRCVHIDAREGILHADWMVSIGPFKNKKAIAKLLIDRKEEVQLALQRLCLLKGEPAITLPREGSVVGVALALVRGPDGQPVWRDYTWFVRSPQRPFSLPFPELELLLRDVREWWQRAQWWYTMREVSRQLVAQQAADRWTDPGRKAEIDLLVRPFLGRAVTSVFAAANQDNQGLQFLLGRCNVEMTKTQALPPDMPLQELLKIYEAGVEIERRGFFGDELGG